MALRQASPLALPARISHHARCPFPSFTGDLDGGGGQYYIHWRDFNRRNDAWVADEDVDWDPEQLGADTGHGHEEPAATHSKAPPPSSTPGGSADTGDELDLDLLEAGQGVWEFVLAEHDEHANMPETAIREHEDLTAVKNIDYIELGRHRISTWYYCPLPKGISSLETLYFDEFSLEFFKTRNEMLRYRQKSGQAHPPGDEVYRCNGISMWECDGHVQRTYCQNLSYLAKLFLDHKTLFFDVDPFMYYVMTEYDETGHHVVGYFSKEKYTEAGFNLACILALPPYQKRGYGRFLIQFSYELSKIERRVGSPEKPLSDLGFLSYRSYWSWVLLNYFHDLKDDAITVLDIMEATCINPADIVLTLKHLGILKLAGAAANKQHVLALSPDVLEPERKRLNDKRGPVVQPQAIHWAPYPDTVRADKWALHVKQSKGYLIPDGASSQPAGGGGYAH